VSNITFLIFHLTSVAHVPDLCKQAVVTPKHKKAQQMS